MVGGKVEFKLHGEPCAHDGEEGLRVALLCLCEKFEAAQFVGFELSRVLRFVGVKACAAISLTRPILPLCDDELKYGVLDRIVAEYRALADAGGSILGRKIVETITVNGVRVHLDDGSWVLVRASSNKPELVVVVESMRSEADMRALFRDEVKPRLAKYTEIGAYNQEL